MVCRPSNPKDRYLLFYSVVKESEVASEILQVFKETKKV
jgi:hypothetical protein